MTVTMLALLALCSWLRPVCVTLWHITQLDRDRQASSGTLRESSVDQVLENVVLSLECVLSLERGPFIKYFRTLNSIL